MENKKIKFLVIGPSWVGDMVMSQSLYKRLLNLYPHAVIDVLAPVWSKPILKRMPEVNCSIDMPIKHGKFDLVQRWQIGRSLAGKNYTHAIIQPNSAKSALIPLFAGIKQRTGWKGEMRYGLLNDLRPNQRIFQYMVEQYVALAHKKEAMLHEVSIINIEAPRLLIDKTTQRITKTRLLLSKEKPVVGLCPGAEFGSSKQWPDQTYAEVASTLIQRGNQVWMFGSSNDESVCADIFNALPIEQKPYCINLAGKTSLVEAVDLLAECHTVISNDSGLMHVAAAVGCNIIAIYGSSSPSYTPPLSNKIRILSIEMECRPCFKRECPLNHLMCLKKLTPSLVLSAYDSLLLP